jgi:CDP-diacylglycerol--glycerol-3-phosphate 3-phosphatidyltransferase
MNIVEQQIEKPTFSDRMRVWFKWVLDPLAIFFNRLGLRPITMTILGLIGTSVGAFMIARGHMTWGGVLILLSVPFDALDGAIARLRGEANDWGAFVDSVSDRYSEVVTHLGLLIYYLNRDDVLGSALVFISVCGSLLVSYVKARADSVGFKANVGILTRVERYLVLAPALVLNYPIVALWIMAILTNFTALQRIMKVRRDAHRRQSKLQE